MAERVKFKESDVRKMIDYSNFGIFTPFEAIKALPGYPEVYIRLHDMALSQQISYEDFAKMVDQEFLMVERICGKENLHESLPLLNAIRSIKCSFREYYRLVEEEAMSLY